MAGLKNLTNLLNIEAASENFGTTRVYDCSGRLSCFSGYTNNENMLGSRYSELLYRPPNPTPPLRYNYETPQILKD